MPKFLTVSPTHVAGKKEYAWNNFKKGGYVAIGWADIYFTHNDMNEIERKLKKEYDNDNSAIISFRKFLALDIGDYVAIPNVNFGIFGIGKIKSGYKYKLHMHDTGSETKEDHFYSHYREVDWLVTDYHKKIRIIRRRGKMLESIWNHRIS